MHVTFPPLLKSRLAIAVAIVWIATSEIRGQQAPPAPVKLESLHGTMITMISDHEGMPMEIWAKGNKVRSEISAGDEKLIIIQRGDTLYTYGFGSPQGEKTRFETGLASLGLIEQIALVKAKGKKDGSQVVEGVEYDQYKYDADAPQEQALVLLEAKTSLPKDWLSVVKNGDSPSIAARTIYRDMQANVDVPDDLFTLPKGVIFAEVTAAELMSTPLPVKPADPPPAPSLTR